MQMSSALSSATSQHTIDSHTHLLQSNTTLLFQSHFPYFYPSSWSSWHSAHLSCHSQSIRQMEHLPCGGDEAQEPIRR